MTFLYKPKPTHRTMVPDTPVNMKRCRVSVAHGTRAPSFHQCDRTAVVFRTHPDEKGKVGYCAQHDPKVVKKRRASSSDRWYDKQGREVQGHALWVLDTFAKNKTALPGTWKELSELVLTWRYPRA